MAAKKTPPYPTIDLFRFWEQGERGEQVRGLGDRMWKVTDLRLAVKDEPVYQIPLAFLDLSAHSFSDEGGLIEFAQHMRHVQESDPDDPIIMDQWGRILDGRHRIVKALLEGRTTIGVKKIPDGVNPTFYEPA